MDASTLCLGALIMGANTGYDIRKLYEEGTFSHFHAASYGSIYPALGKLADEGKVTVETFEQEGKPDKKVYTITDEGQEALVSALYKPLANDKFKSEVVFALVFAARLPPERVKQILGDYKAYLRGNLEGMKAKDPREMSAGRKFVYGMGWTFYQSTLDYIEANEETLLSEIASDQSRKAGDTAA